MNEENEEHEQQRQRAAAPDDGTRNDENFKLKNQTKQNRTKKIK